MASWPLGASRTPVFTAREPRGRSRVLLKRAAEPHGRSRVPLERAAEPLGARVCCSSVLLSSMHAQNRCLALEKLGYLPRKSRLALEKTYLQAIAELLHAGASYCLSHYKLLQADTSCYPPLLAITDCHKLL